MLAVHGIVNTPSSSTVHWEPTAEREARKPATDYRTPRRSAWASGHGRYPTVDKDYDPGYVDPGELTADRWNETH